jgi:hypothetical protein
MTKSKKMIAGIKAINAARNGAALYVLDPQHGWVPAGEKALERAERMDVHALWIYGVKA